MQLLYSRDTMLAFVLRRYYNVRGTVCLLDYHHDAEVNYGRIP